MDQEEAVFDEHVNRVAELIERLEEFEFPDEIPSTPSTAPDSSSKLAKRLRYIEQQKEAQRYIFAFSACWYWSSSKKKSCLTI